MFDGVLWMEQNGQTSALQQPAVCVCGIEEGQIR